jgi:hypothetical protein
MRIIISLLLTLSFLSSCDSSAEADETEESAVQLYLSVNIESGKKLLLSDNSLYEVAPSDVKTASTWLTPFPIQIDASNNATYPCKLTNMTTGAAVKARVVPPSQ